jgi:hypothetical protein
MDHEAFGFAPIQPFHIALIREIGCAPYVSGIRYCDKPQQRRDVTKRMCDEASEIQTDVCVRAEPQRRPRKNKEQLVTLLTEKSLMGLLVNLGSVCHILAMGTRRFGGDAKR